MSNSANSSSRQDNTGLMNFRTDSLQELRQRSLRGISWFIVVAGLILLAISVPDDLANKNYLNLVIDFLGFGTLLVVTILQDRVSFETRAIILVSVTFSQGFADFLATGLLGDSRIWFLFSTIFITILLGFRAGVIANVITIGTSIILSIMVATGNLTLSIPEYQALSTDPGLWLDLLPIYIMASVFTTITIGSIIQGMEQNRDSLETAFSETQELTQQLANERGQLEEQTTTLERRSRYIEAAAEVGKAATSIYNLNELLNLVVDLISKRFGFYQAGIFLLDDRSEYAVMQAASSEGGKRMLARQHRLRVGAEGIVGYVTSQGLARIALDVGEDAVFFNTPELPKTRSEMALPLFYGGRIIGALDVQSTEPNAFSEEDISSLTVLADQVSMAINNARLFSELQTSVEAERQAFGEISRRAWQNLIRRSGNIGYTYTNERVFATNPEWPEEMSTAFETSEVINTYKDNKSISVPVLIANKPVGAIRLQKPDRSVNWTDEEIDLIQELTDRLGQALESARVYQASQRQAVQEQITTEISAQMRQTLDIDTVLKTAAKELGDAFNAKEVVIRMATDE